MTAAEAAALGRAANPAMLAGPLRGLYTEAVERGTLDWDHLEMDNGGTYLETDLTGVYQGDRW